MKSPLLLAAVGLTTLLMTSACGNSSSSSTSSHPDAPADSPALSAVNLKACNSGHELPNETQVIDTGDRIDIHLKGHNLDPNFDVVSIYGRDIILKGAEKITTLLTSFHKESCSEENGTLTCLRNETSDVTSQLYVNGARRFGTFDDNGPAEPMPVRFNADTIKAVVSPTSTEISWLSDRWIQINVASDCSLPGKAETATTEDILSAGFF